MPSLSTIGAAVVEDESERDLGRRSSLSRSDAKGTDWGRGNRRFTRTWALMPVSCSIDPQASSEGEGECRKENGDQFSLSVGSRLCKQGPQLALQRLAAQPELLGDVSKVLAARKVFDQTCLRGS